MRKIISSVSTWQTAYGKGNRVFEKWHSDLTSRRTWNRRAEHDLCCGKIPWNLWIFCLNGRVSFSDDIIMYTGMFTSFLCRVIQIQIRSEMNLYLHRRKSPHSSWTPAQWHPARKSFPRSPACHSFRPESSDPLAAPADNVRSDPPPPFHIFICNLTIGFFFDTFHNTDFSIIFVRTVYFPCG